MSEEILINVTRRETRVAIVENGMLQELMVERSSRSTYLGNIYKGRVSRVLPGMQAAFVDIGLERAAFLHVSDIVNHENEHVPAIGSLVREGSEILVQVIKDPIGSKGARLTANLSIPSRYLVFMPHASQIGVSVRIEDEVERQRLRQIVEDAMPDDNKGGYIVRTNAEGVDQFALRADLNFLLKLWEVIRERSKGTIGGDCIYAELTLDVRALRDLMTADVDRVRVDSEAALQRIRSFAEQFIPQWTNRIEHYEDDRSIFDLFSVEDDIQAALRRHVPLKSGGHLVIDQTEAMTTIDVNTGGFVGYRNLEETIFKTNLEAAQALARQLRLRNLGGIIVIDFIDMNDSHHKQQLMRMLEKALTKDHAKTSISPISPLGLVEMTRKRTSESLEHILCEPCAICSGRGIVKSTETICYEIFREIIRSVRQFDALKLMVLAAPHVVDRILDEESDTVADLEEQIDKTIHFKAEDQYAQEQYDVVLL